MAGRGPGVKTRNRVGCSGSPFYSFRLPAISAFIQVRGPRKRPLFTFGTRFGSVEDVPMRGSKGQIRRRSGARRLSSVRVSGPRRIKRADVILKVVCSTGC